MEIQIKMYLIFIFSGTIILELGDMYYMRNEHYR